MFEPNVATVLERCGTSSRVLDVGGWACPFNRANWVLDAEPYESRGFYGSFGMPKSQGGERECFSKETWIQRDICAREAWPFADKFFDFAICSHTLEDIRDPLFVCAELVRVSKAGYIETPSRRAEQSRGWESPEIVGLSHHRWFVEMGSNHVQFTPKYHCIHGDFRQSFPTAYLRSLRPDELIAFLFWEDTFTASETIIHSMDAIFAAMEGFVAAHYRHSPFRYWFRNGRLTGRRIWNGIQRRLWH